MLSCHTCLGGPKLPNELHDPAQPEKPEATQVSSTGMR
jgi:hypothetical protein